MDTRTSTRKAEQAPQAPLLFDKVHLLRALNETLAQVRQPDYARRQGPERQFIKGPNYTLLSRRETLSLDGRRALQILLRANKRLQTAYLRQESCGQLGDYQRAGWARRCFENWRAALKWHRLQPYEKFAALGERQWTGSAAVTLRTKLPAGSWKL